MENIQEQIADLTTKIKILEETKQAYLLQKGKQVKGITIRTNTESVTLNTLLDNPIYVELVSSFIDGLVPKIDEEISIITNFIGTLNKTIE